jgi:hypothetical protein
MKAFGSFRVCVPLLGLGIVLLLAPQSRAQQEVSPDHFDDNGIAGVAPTKAPAKAKQPSAPVAQSNNKNSAKDSQVAAAKKPTTAQQPELVAVTDKRKTPTRKPNNP